MVVFSQYAMSRNRSVWGPDAGVFRPERWEEEQFGKIGWAYFPFGGGPRQCLGMDLALLEVSYTVVRLLQACSTLALPDGEVHECLGNERQTLTLVLSCTDGCRVAVTRTPR